MKTFDRDNLPPLEGADGRDLTSVLDGLDATMKALKDQQEGGSETESEKETGTEVETVSADSKSAELAAREKSLDEAHARLEKQATDLAKHAQALREHGASRFLGDAATDEAAVEVVKGTPVSVDVQPRVTAVKARGLQELKDSKSLIQMFSAISQTQKGLATDAQREFALEASTKALAEGTGSAGGFLVPSDWMPTILPLFRGVTTVRAANPRIVPFGTGMNQVQLSTGATAYYTPENAAITPSQETFSQVTLLTPHNLTGLVPVSNYLLRDSSRPEIGGLVTTDAEDTVRQDLAVVMALKEDRAFLMGNPSTETGSPTGIINLSGIATNPITPPTNGFQPTLPQLRQIKNYVRRFAVPNPRWTWFFNPQFLSYIESLTDSMGRFLADTSILQVNNNRTDDSASGSIVGQGVGVSGTLDGIPFFCSNQIPVNLTYGSATNATWLLLVDMNQLVIGLNQTMTVDVSSEASYTPDGGTTWINAFQNNQTLFRGVLRHDINHLYPYTVLQQQGVLINS